MTKDLKQIFAEYESEIKYSQGLSAETIRGYRNVFELFLKVMPEVTDNELLTEEMLSEFFKRIRTRKRIVGKNKIVIGVKNSTIKTQYSKLNVFFKWLCDKNYINTNPLTKIKPPRVNYEDFRRLEDKDVHKICTAITLHSNNPFILRRDTFMFNLLLFCGLRKGEFISLRVCDIDIEKKELTVRAETSKSKRVRILKMHPTLIIHLKEYLKERNSRNIKAPGLIVSSRGDRNLSREGLKHWVNSIIKKSGVKFHLHQCRHTFACKLSEQNVNLFKIQKMMGHTDIKMTMKYARSLKTEDMAEDVGKISF